VTQAATGSLPHDLRAAFGFYSRLPVGALADRPIRQRWVLLFGPIVGLAIAGAATIGAWLTLSLVSAPGAGLPAAILAIGTAAYLTRGLHLDGLADMMDGLGSARPAAGSLAVMHRSDIGPFGVISLILVLLLQISALWILLAVGWGWLALLVAMPAGRAAAVWLCRPGVPAAAGSKLGSWVAGAVPTTHAAGLIAIWCALAGALALWAAQDYAVAAVAVGGVLAAWGCALSLGRTACRRFGGITGDVLGAVVEIGQTASLLVLVVGLR